MRPSHTRSWLPVLSVPTALLLSLSLAASALAASWSSPITVAVEAFIGDLATSDNGTAVVAYEKCIGGGFCTNKVYVKRSGDGGLTWGHRWSPPGEAQSPAVAAWGRHVDFVWEDISKYEIGYARSGDGGRTFTATAGLKSETAVYPSVARGPGGLVAIVWGEWPQFEDQISVRVSTNGGVTFGPKSTWRTSEVTWSGVAVGDGVVYVTHLNARGDPVVRRSLDGGQNWTRVLLLDGRPVVTAEGNEAYVAYTTLDANGRSDARYRRTGDKGQTWSSGRHLAPLRAQPWGVDISVQDGVLRALYETKSGFYYRKSANGVDWTSPEFVADGSWAAYVGFVGHAIVLYEDGPKVMVRIRN